MTDKRSEVDERRINLLCHRKKGGGYTVSVGPGWFPPRMRPLFDEHFESAPLLLDFEHLHHVLKKQGAECEIKSSDHFDQEVTARGKSAVAVANWLGGAMASGLVPR